MDSIVKDLLLKVAEIGDAPEEGAYNIRVDGKSAGKRSTANIEVESREDGKGLNIYIKPNTVNETVYIPAIIGHGGHVEEVYNDFYIGENSDITIVAGCGIHNQGDSLTQHDGIHTFNLGKNAKAKYIEKHYGNGEGTGKKILNPVTVVNLDEGSYLEMDTVQIEGVDSTQRVTRGVIKDSATLVVKEKLLTSGNQIAETEFEVDLEGKQSSTNIISRSVAKGNSKQIFLAKITGNNECMGHSECDAIIMDRASVQAIPEITANHVDASLIHEAAIGKIAGEQLTKLMTLGLTQDEAEKQIINGFLK